MNIGGVLEIQEDFLLLTAWRKKYRVVNNDQEKFSQFWEDAKTGPLFVSIKTAAFGSNISDAATNSLDEINVSDIYPHGQ